MSSPLLNKDFVVEWYSHVNVQYQLISFLRDREFCAIDKGGTFSIRNHRVHSTQHLNFMLTYLSIEDKPINLYYSMAKFREPLPFVNMADREMMRQVKDDWNKTCKSKIESYDMLLDFDAPDDSCIAQAHKSMMRTASLLDRWRIPYSVRFSGRGFHIIIPYRDELRAFSTDPDVDFNIYQFHRKLLDYIYENVSELIDRSIADARRVCKIPYSLARYPDGVERVCYPLNTREEMLKWNLDQTIPMFWKRTSRWVRRGVTTFNDDGNMVELIKNIRGT